VCVCVCVYEFVCVHMCVYVPDDKLREASPRGKDTYSQLLSISIRQQHTCHCKHVPGCNDL